MGQGVSSTGWGNARPGTTFADHWFHCPFRTRQVLAPPLRGLLFTWTARSSVSCGPLAARRFQCLFFTNVLTHTTSFHARSGWLTVYSSSFRLRLSDCALTARLASVLSSTILAYVRLLACWDRLPRAALAPSLYRPRGSGYFPFEIMYKPTWSSLPFKCQLHYLQRNDNNCPCW